MAELSHEEAVKLGLEPAGREVSPEQAKALGLEGEPGQPGHDAYAAGPNAPPPERPDVSPLGSPSDIARGFVNTVTFGAAPQIEGTMGALAKGAVEPMATPHDLLEAYRAVRDAGKKEHAQASETGMGKLGNVAGYLVPHPLLPNPTPGATPLARAGQGALVGGAVGAISGAANSPADATSGKLEHYKRLLLDTAGGALGGAVTGGLVGGGMALAENPARSFAEEQALRAAGLRGGIKNSLRKDLGIENMDEARELGRKFLDEGLIPPVGSAEAVGRRAEALQNMSGNAVGATLTQAETSGVPFDHGEMSRAARAPIMDPSKTTAVARAQAGKALDLADQLQQQGADTPGSFLGANRAKSDAWKAANFSADPDLAAVNYRKAVSGARQNIEDQVGRALGPDAAQNLAEANRRFGVAADAQKLSENASTRDAAKKGFTMGDLLALITGTAAGGASGHTVAVPAATAAAVLGHKAFDKWGHSTASRLSDALANRFSENTGGHLGGMVGESVSNKLAPWESMLKKDEK